MKFSTIAALACASIIAACTPATQATKVADRPITKGFDGAGFDWRGSSTETVVLYDVFNRGGQVEVCGAIFTEGTQTLRNTELEMLKAGRLLIGGTTIADNLSFFNRIRVEQDNPTAGCAVTAVPWNDNFDSQPPELKMRSNSFVI